MSNLKTLDSVTGKHDSYAWVSTFNELFDSKYTTLHQLAGWFDIEDSEIWEKYVLDIVQEYVKEGHHVFEAGFDGSDRAIQHLRHAVVNANNNNFFVGTIPDALSVIESGQYDVTISHSVFQYMSKQNALLAVDEMLRITKPGGVVIIGDICDEAYKEDTESAMKQHWGEDYQSKLPGYLYLSKSFWKCYEDRCDVLVRNSSVEEYWRRESRYITYLRKRIQV
ncbi:11057_t:CDS:2 [Dentiscutata erythropus]|uniref:11057_t:CDS:1 n=1 Tax=Dentiscutata erythropus TaxID=1348616 RepID=A0A9N9JKN0_9GLOM|nr:11057_t:CDS:2 [Dentiscutata erythropus]